jgi:hypothetical protein
MFWLQVAAQDVAMGVKFSAACTLEIQEYPQGIPDGLCAADGNWDSYFPQPWGGSSNSSASVSSSSSSVSSMDVDIWRDISFASVEGDFQVRLGLLANNSRASRYSLRCAWTWFFSGCADTRVANMKKAIASHEHLPTDMADMAIG